MIFTDLMGPRRHHLTIQVATLRPATQLIAIRIDAGVLEAFRKEARRRGIGYQSLINEVLARHVRRGAA